MRKVESSVEAAAVVVGMLVLVGDMIVALYVDMLENSCVWEGAVC